MNVFTPAEVLQKIYQARNYYGKPRDKILSRTEIKQYFGEEEFYRMEQSIQRDVRYVLIKGQSDDSDRGMIEIQDNSDLWKQAELQILGNYASEVACVSPTEGVPLEFGILMYGVEFLRLFKRILEEENPDLVVDDKW